MGGQLAATASIGGRSGAPAGPARPSERLVAIDVLRGLALFGVLAINLDTEFRVTFFEQFLPPPASAPALDRAVEAFLKIAIEFKAFSLFAFLFGVGLAIQFERLAGRSGRARLLVRRLLFLLAFGLVHLVLIWNGDILTEYAVAGFLVLPFLFARKRVVVLAAGVALVLYLAMPWLPLPFGFPARGWLAAHAAAARQAYGHGAFSTILAFRIGEIPDIARFHVYVLPRTVAMMLLGALAWRTRLLSGAGARGKLLGGTAVAAIGLGAILTALGRRALEPVGVVATPAAVSLAGDLAPVVLALGYAALVVWAVTCTRFAPLLAWAAPVGRMAFTNYVMQSLVLGFLFYGYGLGLMGRLGVAAGLAVAVAFYAAQVGLSAWWLRRCRFGPVEWLWRSLMYGTRQPWTREAA
jgi:uncharacterized protein